MTHHNNAITLRRKQFEQILISQESISTSNIWDLFEDLLKKGVLVKDVQTVEKLDFETYGVTIREEADPILYRIPRWFAHWARKVWVTLGSPDKYVFTHQQIIEAIEEINEIEAEMLQDLQDATKIETFIKYCEIHKDEEIPYWVHGLQPDCHYAVDDFLRELWNVIHEGVGGGPTRITSTDQICNEHCDPYFVQMTIPAWMTQFFQEVEKIYADPNTRWPLTWGDMVALIK